MIGCEYCLRIGEHASSCPNYKEPKCRHVCIICGEGIQVGEEYIKNDDDDYAHWECINSARDLVRFLGYEIKEMEDDIY